MLLFLRAFAEMFYLFRTLLPPSFTGLAASCPSRLSSNAISQRLSWHPSPAVFYFLQSSSLSFSFIYYFLLFVFAYFLYSTVNMWASWEHKHYHLVYHWVLCSACWLRWRLQDRFNRFGCCQSSLLCDFTPVASFCMAQFSHVKT